MAKTIILIMSLFIFIFTAGCGQNPTSVNQPTPTGATGQGYPPSNITPIDQGYPAPTEVPFSTAYPVGSGIQIITSDGQIQGLSISDLNNLSKATVGSDSGPKVADVLKLAGVNDFASLAFIGSNGSTTLTKDKVNDQVILSLANNSITLVIAGIPQENWIKDITSIKVQ